MTVDEQVDAEPKTVQDAYIDLLLEEYQHQLMLDRLTAAHHPTVDAAYAACEGDVVAEAEELHKHVSQIDKTLTAKEQDEHWHQVMHDVDAKKRKDDPAAWAKEQNEKAGRLAKAKAIVAAQ
jgi:uncharacterized protein YycO